MIHGLVDGRPRLREPYNVPGAYTAHCLTMSPILFPVTIVDDGRFDVEFSQRLGLPFGKSTYRKALTLAKAQYEKQKAYPALLAMTAQMVDVMVAQMQIMAKAGTP